MGIAWSPRTKDTMDGNKDFHKTLGMVENNSIKGQRTVQTPDSIKLPLLPKPVWMESVEAEMLKASPPMVGRQVARHENKRIIFFYRWKTLDINQTYSNRVFIIVHLINMFKILCMYKHVLFLANQEGTISIYLSIYLSMLWNGFSLGFRFMSSFWNHTHCLIQRSLKGSYCWQWKVNTLCIPFPWCFSL